MFDKSVLVHIKDGENLFWFPGTLQYVKARVRILNFQLIYFKK